VPSTDRKVKSILNTGNKTHRRIEEITAGLASAWTNNLLSLPEEIATVIVDYIKAMKSEVNRY
jgi:hypothetical protein